MSEWKEYKLGEITESCLGKMLDAKKNKGIPQPYLANVNVRWGSFDLENLQLMRFEEHENERYGLKYGDLIVCEGGEPGRCAIWKEQVPNMKIQKALHRVRCHENVDYRFLYYYMLWAGKKGLFDPYCTGSTIKHLPREKLKVLPVKLPPLEEQKRIAGILRSLDDKIELNNKINDNLEKQAQALFKNWFIDYAPFGGEMPEDWRMYQLSELTDFVPGYSYKGSELVESNIGMATIKNFERNGGFKLDGFKDIQPSDKIKNTQYVDVFDILVSHTDLTQNAEVIGNAELILSKGKYQKLIMSMDLVKVVAKNGVSPFLIASILRTDRFKKHCLGYVNGTTVLHMSKKALPEYEIALPRDLSVLDSFAKMSESMIRQMSICIEENQRLTTLCDTLLPKLMSDDGF